MGGPAVIPAAPVAAPAPAAPAAAPAPVSTPAAPVPASPSGGAGEGSGAPGAGSPGSGTPANATGGAAPAAVTEPAAPAKAAPPKPEDFASNSEGLEDYLNSLEEWRAKNPDDAAALTEQQRKEAAQERAGAQPKEDEAKPEEKPAAEAPKDPAAANVEAATPQALDEVFTKNPALKAAFDADPAAKETLMATARAAEAAKPMLALLPTIEDAKLAVEQSSKFLDIQHKFAMSTDIPELGEAGFNDLVDLFTARDDKGAVLQQNGKPVMNESWDFLTRKILGGGITAAVGAAEARVESLKAQVAAGTATQDKLTDAEYELAALKFSGQHMLREEDEFALPELDANATPAQKAFQEKLRQQADEAKKTQAAGSKATRAAAAAAFETKMDTAYRTGVGRYLDTEIKARRDRGEYIPDIVLTQKWIDPATRQPTTVSDFAMRMKLGLDEKMLSIPTIRTELLRLTQMGAAGEAARVAAYDKYRNLYLPGLVNAYLDEVQGGVRQMAGQRQQQAQRVAEVARVEPVSTGSAPAPTALKGEALEARALDLLKDDPEFRGAAQTERWEMMTNKMEEIRAGKV